RVLCITRSTMLAETKTKWFEFMRRECEMEKGSLMDEFCPATLQSLAQQEGIMRVLVEAGATMFQGFYQAGFWNEIHLYVDSQVIIGKEEYAGLCVPLNLGEIEESKNFGST